MLCLLFHVISKYFIMFNLPCFHATFYLRVVLLLTRIVWLCFEILNGPAMNHFNPFGFNGEQSGLEVTGSSMACMGRAWAKDVLSFWKRLKVLLKMIYKFASAMFENVLKLLTFKVMFHFIFLESRLNPTTILLHSSFLRAKLFCTSSIWTKLT